tara:strand:+ start:176 stop:547 length:372 start_codon:yes stop_codon:yes gene_type:complete
MKHSKEELLATIEKLKKQVKAIDTNPNILSMEVTVNFEVAKEDEKVKYSFYEANDVEFTEGWRLPTKDELEIMYVQKVITNGCYWSSTEFDNLNAWIQDLTFGYQYDVSKEDEHYVRVVRTIN